MGVYITDMEKPKRCIEELDYGLLDNPCLFVDEREACLLQRDSKMGEYEENYKTCPLIEIVTCGECKFWESAKNGWNGYCNKKVDAFNTFYKTDWCSFGERRADDKKIL